MSKNGCPQWRSLVRDLFFIWFYGIDEDVSYLENEISFLLNFIIEIKIK